jgi:uncharacterized membrane protein
MHIERQVDMFPTLLILATLLCSLVGGFLFAFAVVVMPGIKSLSDRDYIRAFQVIDGVIQNNQPLFMLVWVGSVVVLIAAAVLGVGHLDATQRSALIAATALYLLGVQLPTMAVNVPLNNRLQSLDVDAMNDADLHAARAAFEPRWNRWNRLRTILATVTTGGLMILFYAMAVEG